MNRCLLVGINEYRNFNGLDGCVNDAQALHPLLAIDGKEDRNFDCQIEASPGGLNRDQLLRRLKQLFANGPDCAVFYFAGHGTPIDGDVALVTTDGTGDTPGVQFQEVLGLINKSSIAEIIVILDCCFSGGAAQMPLLGAGAHLRKGLSILTASRDDQVAVEDHSGRGRFSSYLEAALDEGAADLLGNTTVSGIYAYVSELLGAWDQRPTFKANIDRLHNLRPTKPRVALPILRQLVDWFPSPTGEKPLDPSYEPTVEPRNVEHEAVFAKLQLLRTVHLVEPVGEEHLYYAAMNSRSCRLTALGRHYHQLVTAGRI